MMASKRKGAGAEKKGSSKKSRKEDSPLPALTEDDAGGTEVAWALPTQDSNTNQPDRSAAITRYAPILYERSWATIRTVQRPFKFPALRTPLYKAKGKDLDGQDAHQSSAALRDLYNAIKHATQELSEDGEQVRTAFTRAFTNANDSSAVVASRSATAPILALDQDYRVEV
jgi:hypothetical protein